MPMLVWMLLAEKGFVIAMTTNIGGAPVAVHLPLVEHFQLSLLYALAADNQDHAEKICEFLLQETLSEGGKRSQ